MNDVMPAEVTWREDEQGNLVPVSQIFGDVYYSLVDGLAESRYVFIEQNNLSERFSALFNTAKNSADSQHHSHYNALSEPTSNTSFTIAELGFGTGLNVLATWQLWRQIQQIYDCETYVSESERHTTQKQKTGNPSPRLHIISTEKHPLTFDDLNRSLTSWKQRDPSLTPFITQLLAVYPTLVAGCHRLHLAHDVTLDLWLGDATVSLQTISHNQSTHNYNHKGLEQNSSHLTAAVDAWYLDGFAPSCNESLWATQIFEQLGRLSKIGTTVATFSSAGVVKRGLKSVGFSIKKTKGFGRKREMLTATKTDEYYGEPLTVDHTTFNQTNNHLRSTISTTLITPSEPEQATPPISHYRQVAIIGAGISGLMAAWSLAQRGIEVTLLDKTAPLAGASGNPRALLAPKMTPLGHVAEHLHSISYLYSQRLYRQLSQEQPLIFEPTATLDLLLKANVTVDQIAQYPQQMATTLTPFKAHQISGLQHQDLQENLFLPQAGLVNPKALSDVILAHPNISYKKACVTRIKSAPNKNDENKTTSESATITLVCQSEEQLYADAVIIAAAYHSSQLDSRIFDFRKIRGQLSWFTPSAEQLDKLPKLPLKYGGYCARFLPHASDADLNPVIPNTPTFLLGASFVRNDISTDIHQSEHRINRDKLTNAVPELEALFTTPSHSADNEVFNGDAVIKSEGEVNDQAFEGWQARVGIRAQTPDYHPAVGRIDEDGLIWTISGMGSKGYAFAPLCAEALADMMMGNFTPLPHTLLDRLSPKRKRLQQPLN